MSIKIDELADAVNEALADYADDVTQDVKADVLEVAKQCAKDIKKNAKMAYPNGKKYANDWRATTTDETPLGVVVTIHSPKHYALAHLLEHGHAKRNGGRVEGRPHIAPAEQKANEALIKKIKLSIKK